MGNDLGNHPLLQLMACQCGHSVARHVEPSGGHVGACRDCDCKQAGIAIDSFQAATGVDPQMGEIVGRITADGEFIPEREPEH